MAKEIVEAVICKQLSGGTSFLLDKYNDRRRTNTEEKLERLELLVLELRGISEVTNSEDLRNFENLCRWKEKFDEAASQGDEVIRLFKARALHEKTEKQRIQNEKTEYHETENQTSENEKTEDQETENEKTENQKTENEKAKNEEIGNQKTENRRSGFAFASSSKNVAKRIKRWFSGDDDIKLLNNTLKRLEVISKTVNKFRKLVMMRKQQGMDLMLDEEYEDCGIVPSYSPVCGRMKSMRPSVVQPPVWIEWLEKVGEVTIEGEHELQILCVDDREDSSIQHAPSLDTLLTRLRKVATDINDLREALDISCV